MAASCAKGGAATNVIEGLAVGYNSCIVPCFAMAATVYVSFNLCLMYGIALAALGVLSTMSIGLTIDAYGPISDNAGGIVEMAHMHEDIREVTDDLDAAGNTTAAIGKGFAISSAAFVGLALYGAFVTHCGIPSVNIVDSRTFPGLLVGAMLPYWFSGMTMTSVNKAAMEMVWEIKRQFTGPDAQAILSGAKKPDYEACVRVATNSSLYEMIAPAGLVMLTPVITGVLFGKEALAGLLPGATISGVEMAISMSNTGGAWDNAKKYIEGGQMVVDEKGRFFSDIPADERAEAKLHIVRKRAKWTDLSGTSSGDGETGANLPGWKQELLAEIQELNLVFGSYDKHAAQAGGEQSIRDIDHGIHSAAVIGDTIGDPLKDTSGPALNILIKLMAIISVVFVPVVNSSFGGLLFNKAFKNFTQCASEAGNGCASQ
jgi:Na+/H+-translocating membrane pyrophosphatase